MSTIEERLRNKEGKCEMDLIRDAVELNHLAQGLCNTTPSGVALVFMQPATIDPDGGLRRNEFGYARTWPCWVCGECGLWSYCVELQSEPNRYSVWKTLCDVHEAKLKERYHGVRIVGRPSLDFLKAAE